MEELKIKVDSKHAGKRLDKFLVEVLEKRFSRSFIKKLIDGKNISVDGSYTNAHYKVSPGEAIKVTIPEPKSLELKPEDIPLDLDVNICPKDTVIFRRDPVLERRVFSTMEDSTKLTKEEENRIISSFSSYCYPSE